MYPVREFVAIPPGWPLGQPHPEKPTRAYRLLGRAASGEFLAKRSSVSVAIAWPPACSSSASSAMAFSRSRIRFHHV